MNALELYDYLRELNNNYCIGEGPALEKINVNIKGGALNLGDTEPAVFVGEDLYDSETNSILTDIVISSISPNDED